MSVLIEKPVAAVVVVGSMLVLATLLMARTPNAAAQHARSDAASTRHARALQLQMERGKQVYEQVCLACHQVGGTGVSGMNPPLIQTKWVLGNSTPLIQVVLTGMTGEVEINGDTYANVMPPQSHLTDQQIADVLTFVRNSFGNKATPVTVAQVKVTRGQTK